MNISEIISLEIEKVNSETVSVNEYEEVGCGGLIFGGGGCGATACESTR